MDLSALSSNWRKLKGALESSKKREDPPNPRTQPLSKRKLSHDAPRPKKYDHTSKKRKLDDVPHNASRSHELPLSRRKSKSERPRPVSAPNGVDGFAREHGIPSADITAAYGVTVKSKRESNSSHTPEINSGLTSFPAGKYIAMDCEMVGVGPNPDNSSQLARVSIVNYHGQQLYDSFVQPVEPVTDYRTAVSGVRPYHLSSKYARPFAEVQSDVANLMKDRILVGHAISNDLQVLLLAHPRRDIRDTSKHRSYKQINGGWTPSLRLLAKEVLGIEIQGGEHSSIEDARATMALFKKQKDAFEDDIIKKFGKIIKVEPTEDDEDQVKDKSKKAKKKKSTKKKKKRSKR
jgi:RNA exonuclease 4